MCATFIQMDLDDSLLRLIRCPRRRSRKRSNVRIENPFLIFIFTYQILQDVMKEKTIVALWLEVEQLYMTKSLLSKFHSKQRLYSHRMAEGTSLEDNLTTFKGIIYDLEAMEVKYDKEDLGLILLCSFPPSYSNFRYTILYSSKTLTLDEIYDALFSSEKMKHLVVRSEAQAEGFVIQGKTHKKNFGGGVGNKT